MHGLNILAAIPIAMANTSPPTIDPQAAHRWQHLPASESPWLHEEVARRMQERLDLIKQRPASWLHWAPISGGLQAHALVAARYPKAACTVLEISLARAATAGQLLTAPWWSAQRWMRPRLQVCTEVTSPVQMLWANMSLHMAADPQTLLQQWHRSLQIDGFLMFSCLGPDTLAELRALYQALGWPAPSHEFTDMHDWGDMLVAAGFAEPVMDMERINLTFDSPKRLLQELRELGRNLNVGRFPTLRGRHWYAKLLDAVERMPPHLTFEVVYGHAFRPTPRLPVSMQSEITLDQMRATLGLGKVVARETQ